MLRMTKVQKNAVSPLDYFESRRPLRDSFLARAGWGVAALSSVGQDSAFRRYVRAAQDGRTAVLMEAVPDGGPLATPGHSLRDFIRIGSYLRDAGLRTPEIYAADETDGYILMEDFGDVSFGRALESGARAEDLYSRAVDVLSFIRDRVDAGGIVLPDYYASHVHAGRRRLVDWYLPALRGARNPDGLAEDYLAVWDGIEKALPPCPQGFLHIDYHVENLMALPDGACGLLDFQGAMRGPVPYDLANLLEDARIDVPEEIRGAMLARFCAGMEPGEKEAFENWYRVLATQFHCRVAGQFIRLAVRDGKTRYLELLPRVAGYLEAGLRNPVLRPLREWLLGQGSRFSGVPVIDLDKIGRVIRDDAF